MTFFSNSGGEILESDIHGQDSSNCASDYFINFANLCEAIQNTPRKAEKSKRIADYLRTLEPEHLVIATRCLSGYIFPLREHKTLNISSLVVLNCFAACAGVPGSFVRERLTKHTDIGDLAFELFSGGLPIVIPETLTLTQVTKTLTALSTMSGTRRKSEIIIQLLRKASPLEAKYLVRIMTGDLAIGVQESDVEDAVSQWKDISFSRVQSANVITGDIGETALLCYCGKIEEARLRLFKPTHFMHAQEISIGDEVVRHFPQRLIVEDKFDGIRAQVHIGLDISNKDESVGTVYEGLRIVVYSDLLEDVTERFIDLVPGLAGLMSEQAGTVDAVGVIYDGVIVPTRAGEIRPFMELQKRLAASTEADNEAVMVTIGYIVFDILLSEGRSLVQEDWATRGAVLDKTNFDAVSTFRARSHFVSTNREVENILEMALLRGSQGVMIKDPRSSYKPARRGKDWMKIIGQPCVTSG